MTDLLVSRKAEQGRDEDHVGRKFHHNIMNTFLRLVGTFNKILFVSCISYSLLSIELAKGFILNYTFQNCIELMESYVLYWIQWCWSEDKEENKWYIYCLSQLLNTNISVNTFSFMNDTNLIKRCQAEEGGVRDQTGRLQNQTVEERRGFSRQKVLNLSIGTSNRLKYCFYFNNINCQAYVKFLSSVL